MVVSTIAIRTHALLADDSTPTVLEQLDPPTRAKVLMALLGLVLLGIAMIACVMIGGRWVRRLALHSPRSATIRKQSIREASRKAATSPVARNTGDTFVGERQTDETVTD